MSDNRPTQVNEISAVLGLLAFIAMVSSLGFMTYHVGVAAYTKIHHKLVDIDHKVVQKEEPKK